MCIYVFTVIIVDCACDISGTLDADTGCDSEGKCSCEPHAAGDKCDTCIRGYYGLQQYEQCQG